MLGRILATTAFGILLSCVCTGIVTASFHSGGVGSCGGCHASHETGAPSSGLLASDSSSVCLACHAGPGGPSLPAVYSFDGSAMSPGGDFYWLTKTFSWTGGSGPAARHGHNVVALDFGLTADPNKVRSPGGSYPVNQLSCISCHDPHGRSRGGSASVTEAISASGSYGSTSSFGTSPGNYRLLGGAGYVINGYGFNYPVPLARQSGGLPFAESDDSHVDYGDGMSQWCANCHQALYTNNHLAGSGQFKHPVGAGEPLTSEVVDRYNRYVVSGDMSGSVDTAYLQFVPFERGTTNVALLDPRSRRGPDGNSRLSCLTCHRAHASAFSAIGRWDFNATRLADSHPAVGDSGVTGSDVVNSYYGRDIAAEFDPAQGPFCEKCHDAAGL